jgi:hypothetical protein
VRSLLKCCWYYQSTNEVTLGIYAHALPSMQADAAAKLANILQLWFRRFFYVCCFSLAFCPYRHRKLLDNKGLGNFRAGSHPRLAQPVQELAAASAFSLLCGPWGMPAIPKRIR